MSSPERLIYMANQIGWFFRSQGHDLAVAGVADHIKKFWDPLCSLLDHMEEQRFIRPGLVVKYLVADRVEDIVPMLTRAAQSVAEPDKAMKPPLAGRV